MGHEPVLEGPGIAYEMPEIDSRRLGEREEAETKGRQGDPEGERDSQREGKQR